MTTEDSLPPADSRTPTLTIGLPVYNGEEFLAQALDALLAQTYTDFELIISDNASTDGTESICRRYAARDRRIRYVRQPVNIGLAANHNVLVPMARGRYFKWASHDDLYAPDLVRLCVEALEEHHDVVLAHAWDALVDEAGEVILKVRYPLNTTDRRPWARLRSLLYTPGGNDFYGVMPVEVLRRVGGLQSYYNSDRTFVAALVLQGPFFQVPETLYFRRDHDSRASRAKSRRAVTAALDPRRADRVRNPMVRLYTEYVLGFFSAVWRAPLSGSERVRCLAEVGVWLLSCLWPGRSRQPLEGDPRKGTPSR